jgi:hypothetical protein
VNPEGAFAQQLVSRRVTAPYPGTIEMVYMTQQPTAKDIWLPVLVLRRDDNGELESMYVNKVRIDPSPGGGG